MAGSLLAALMTGAPGAQADVFISVDKATQRMVVVVDGEQRHSWLVSTGLPRYATPNGAYTPFRLVADHFSQEWDDAPMPHSIFFTTRGHAIHGSDATKRLGSPASHGCIRLSRENAAVLFRLVKQEGLENTKVVVTGDEEALPMAGKKDRLQTAEHNPAAVVSKKDQVQSTGQRIASVSRRKERVRIAEREQPQPRAASQRKPKTHSLYASRSRAQSAETREQVVQYQYQQPQPFWSPFSHAPGYGYGWR
jgi:hypothetical protein